MITRLLFFRTVNRSSAMVLADGLESKNRQSIKNYEFKLTNYQRKIPYFGNSLIEKLKKKYHGQEKSYIKV